MSETHSKSGGGINRRSPPVLILGTVSAVILTPGWEREQHSARMIRVVNSCWSDGPRAVGRGHYWHLPSTSRIIGEQSAPHGPQRSDGRKGTLLCAKDRYH